MISLIAAMASNRVIGDRGRLPWKMPADLQYFKKITLGKPVLMGRKTFESIGRPLPGRRNIVLTRDPSFAPQGCEVVHSLNEALDSGTQPGELMVIGGAELYRQALSKAKRVYLTLIQQDFPGDAWFPELDPEEWREISRSDHRPDERNPYPYSFVVFERRG